MTDVRCKECTEVNDCNALKCENCKACLVDTSSSEGDECENDFRFIEEAEKQGEIYKLENLDDVGFLLGELPTIYSPKYDFKIEKELDFCEDVSEESQIQKETDVSIQKSASPEHEYSPKRDTSEISGIQYQCTKCSKSFKRNASLKAHIKKDHTEVESHTDFENKSKSKSASDLSDLSESFESDYVPSINDKQNASRKKRPRQRLKKKSMTPSTESDSENNTPRKKPTTNKRNIRTRTSQILLDVKQNKQLKPHMVYKCTACEKITNNYEEHLKHIVIHEAPPESLTETTSLEKLKKTPSGFLKCKQCESVFMNQRDYNIHEKMHRGGKVFQCKLCQAFLVNQSSLEKHTARLHKKTTKKKDKQYECIVCNAKFSAQILMIHHRKTHTDFIKKMEEMTIMEKQEGKTIYVCKLCAKTSKNKYRHEEHLRVHTKEKPYKCERCGTRISTANALAHHLRLHDDERPFQCDICEATYRHKKSLQKHLRRHTGEKPFKCHYCVKTFAFNYTRAGHERNCHIDEHKSRKQWKQQTEVETERVKVPTTNKSRK